MTSCVGHGLLRLCVAVLAANSLALGITFEISFDVNADSLPVMEGQRMQLFSSAAKFNEKGLKEFDRGKILSARGLFEQALSAFPGYSDARNNLGLTYYESNEKDEALRIWQETFENDSLYDVAAYNAGLLLAQRDQNDEALVWANRAYFREPNTPPFGVLKGVLEYQNRNYTEAILAWERALKADRKAVDLHAYIAMAYKHMGDHRKARRILAKGLKSDRRSPVLLSMAADAEFEKGDFGKALSLLKEGDANKPEIAFGLGLCYFETGQFARAATHFQNYVKQRPHDPDGLLNLGNTLSRLKDVPGAERAYAEGLRHSPEDKDLLYNLGGILFGRKKYSKAVAIWLRAEQEMPDDAMLLKWIGKAYYHGKRWEKAKEYLEKSLGLRRDNEAMDVLAICHMRLGNSLQAKNLWSKLRKSGGGAYSSSQVFFQNIENRADIEAQIRTWTRKKPGNQDQAFARAVRLSRLHSLLGNYPDAIGILKPWTEKRPHISLPLLSAYHRQAGELEQALEYVRKLEKVAPDYRRIKAMIGDILAEMGHFKEALAELRNERSPNAMTHYQIGYCLQELGKLKESEGEFRRSSKLDPKMPAAKALLAYVIRKSDSTRVGEAQQLWAEAAELDGNNADVASNIGLTHYQKGEYEKALQYARQAVRSAPNRKRLHLQLGNVHFKMKDYDDALSEYRLALAGATGKLRCSAESNVAAVYIAQKDWERIVSEFRSRVKGCDSLLEPMFLACYHTDQHERALFYFAQVPHKRRVKANLYQAAGRLLYERKEYGRAAKAFLESKDTTAKYFNLAQCYLKSGETDKAIPYALRFREESKSRDRYEADLLLGLCYFAQKDYDRATRSFQNAYNLDSEDHRAPMNLALLYARTGDFEKGKTMYAKARRLRPTIWHGHPDVATFYEQAQPGRSTRTPLESEAGKAYNRAVELHQEGNLKAAESLYVRAVVRDSTLANAWTNLGLLYQARKREAKAERAFRKALAADSLLPEAYFNITALYWNKGDSLSAVRWLERGLRLCPENDELRKLKTQLR